MPLALTPRPPAATIRGVTETPDPDHEVEDAAPRRGLIEIVCGCMFSGKTTALLRILRSEPEGVVLVVKHNRDNRYSRSRILTHCGEGRDAVCVSKAREIFDHVTDAAEVIAIDEGHFYDPELPDVCQTLASAGKRVIVTTLDLDMWGLPFPTIERLKEIAGVVRVMQAECAVCGRPATRTHRKTPIVGRNLVGGSEDFEPRCPECWSPPPEEHIDSAQMA